jgi:F420-non-reducing hydrogenase small subunit
MMPAKKSSKAPSQASAKPKIALYWCASCGGCEEAVVDLREKILDVVAQVDIVFWPCALDPKRSDVEAMPDGSLAVALINGAIRSSEQEHMVRLLRQKAQLVVAFGACAWTGGIPALANLTTKAAIYKRSYLESPTVVNPQGVLPKEEHVEDGHTLELPLLYDTVYKLDDIISVDYYLPGCPPTPDLIATALGAIVSGQLPPRGSVIGSDKALCTDCSRNETKPDVFTIKGLKRIHEIQANPDECFLTQGVLCMGPATRSGCGQQCISGNMPCTGCFGSVGDGDPGARMISALGGVLEAEQEDAVKRMAVSMADPAGTFYRYSMSASLLGRQRDTKEVA